MTLTRGRPRIFHDTDGAYKLCVCGVRFPVEYTRRAQITSRALCDACRVDRRERRAADLPIAPPNAPRCADCLCLIGLVYGSTATHVNAAGLCSACARWAAKWSNSKAEGRLSQATDSENPPGDTLDGVVDLETSESPLVMPGSHTAAMAGFHAAVAAMAAAYIYKPADILGQRRTDEIAALRHGLARALRAVGWPLGEIAIALGRSHHTTVISALRVDRPDVFAAEAIARRYVQPLPLAEYSGISGYHARLDWALLRDWAQGQGGRVRVAAAMVEWGVTHNAAYKRLQKLGLRPDGRTGAFVWPEGAGA